ncbi:MAG: hypothetical protein ACKO96_36155, partial [Flammeovirgaceae bacterium]
ILNPIHNLLFAVIASLLCEIQILLLFGWGGSTFTIIFEEKDVATCAICCPELRHIKLELTLLSLIVVDFAEHQTRHIVKSSPLVDFVTLRVRDVHLADGVEDY